MIRPNDDQYWLYAAVAPETNEFIHIQLETTTDSVLAQQFLAELRKKHDVDDTVFLIDDSHSLKDACSRHGLDLRDERHGDRTHRTCLSRYETTNLFAFKLPESCGWSLLNVFEH